MREKMLALQVLDVKQFMVKLFYQPVFDQFYVKELTVRTFFDFSMNGKRNIEYYSLEEQDIKKQQPKIYWEEVKPFIFQLIKGNRTPLALNLVLQFGEEQTKQILKLCGSEINLEDSIALYINIRFESGKLILTSGVARAVFTLDKTLDRVFEQELMTFLKNADIAIQQE